MVVGHSCVFSWSYSVKSCPPGHQWDRYRFRVSSGLRNADLVTAPTSWMLQQLRRHYGPFMTMGAIYNGRSLAMPDEPKKEFVFASGRLWDTAKNFSLLDEVARDVPWPIYVAGDPSNIDGTTVQFKDLRLLGHLSKTSLPNWLARAPIFALPVRYEPFGLGALEAGLAQCALVLGDTPSLREVWDSAALFVSPDNPDELRSCIKTLIDKPDLRVEMGKKSRDRALKFSSTSMGRKYWETYSYLWSIEKTTRDFCARIPVSVETRVSSPPALKTRPDAKLTIALFYHSLVSDWNNGNAHFLRGIATELCGRGHTVRIYEPRGGWSMSNLLVNEGPAPVEVSLNWPSAVGGGRTRWFCPR